MLPAMPIHHFGTMLLLLLLSPDDGHNYLTAQLTQGCHMLKLGI
jgi:hypothetical protein